MAFDAVEPIGEARRDFRAAMQMALLANVNRDEKQRKKPFSYEDFLPDWWGMARTRTRSLMRWWARLKRPTPRWAAWI